MTAPWRHRMVPGTAPAPIYADDPPLFDGRRPAAPVATADSAALAALHAPASIARRRAATARQDRPASGPPADRSAQEQERQAVDRARRDSGFDTSALHSPDHTTGAAGTGESMGDFMQRAQEALSIEANRWAPQVGEVISGRLVRCRAIEGQYDKPFRVLTLVPFGGGPAIDVSEKTALKEGFDEVEKLGIGCSVAVKYLGSRVGKSGGRYEAYTCYSERGEAQAQPAQPEPPRPGYPQGGAGGSLPKNETQPAPAAATGTVADPTPEQATDTATLTALAKAALETGDTATLTRIGARAKQLGMVWDRAAQCYNAPAPAADAVL